MPKTDANIEIDALGETEELSNSSMKNDHIHWYRYKGDIKLNIYFSTATCCLIRTDKIKIELKKIN